MLLDFESVSEDNAYKALPFAERKAGISVGSPWAD
jgi:hypothetical protein